MKLRRFVRDCERGGLSQGLVVVSGALRQPSCGSIRVQNICRHITNNFHLEPPYVHSSHCLLRSLHKGAHPNVQRKYPDISGQMESGSTVQDLKENEGIPEQYLKRQRLTTLAPARELHLIMRTESSGHPRGIVLQRCGAPMFGKRSKTTLQL